MLCEIPKGKKGRPSKSLTLDQAASVLKAAEGTTLYAYLVVSLLIGARTEELRALTWSHVHLDGRPDDDPPVPPSIMVWHSVRVGGDTKTEKSRRTLALPKMCVEALKAHRESQALAREKAGDLWQENDLVFATRYGTELDAGNVRRAFRVILKRTDIDPAEWTPRELRHSFFVPGKCGAFCDELAHRIRRFPPRITRHTAASRLVQDGVPLYDVQALLGHESFATTQRYAHLQPDAHAKIRESWGRRASAEGN
ncbi:tyrosine-type recombinase/integrase [Sphaerisporangium viridialbum]|uniref:tyrosine-type recombinase/integrase n=1 Tax=Sphaerisporangium viridialbum TaxID=46189 RepID=UPI003C71513A